ncbi:MAG: polyprenyl synthetase family protein [Deltaproteobacteria bacterium]|nr:polyprenyl synthetase family protein [Candidatus Anaeroferrophillacea bacterium]
MDDVFNLIRDELRDAEAAYTGYLQTNVSLIPKISEHIILSGGKRLRPALLILTMRMLGGAPGSGTALAAVIEFIHTATLLHDDVVDEADMRRGLAAANAIWGNEASVLVGDFLFSTAFDLAVDQRNIAILKALSSATRRLAEGEILELMRTADVDTTETDYRKIIEGKTAVLMAAACECGALLAGDDPGRQEKMRSYGLHAGMAFQIIDDILDYTSREEALGKSIGIDLEEGKLTLPLIRVLEQAAPAERERVRDIILADFVSPEDFSQVLDLIRKYRGIEFSTARATEHVEAARELLADMPASPYRGALDFLARYIVNRDR